MTRKTMMALAMGGLIIAGTPFAANAQSANTLANAESVCSSYGLDHFSLGYQSCVDNEMTSGVNTAQAIVAPDDQPHIAVSSDSYGFSYDRQGNLLDAGGYVIRPVPLRP